MNPQPLQVTVSRGGITESRHSVHAIIVGHDGRRLASWGVTDRPVFPRSAIKAMQALALLESGGAQVFSDAEVALMCASHNGEPEHVETVRRMLEKLNLDESAFECGCHWPLRVQTGYDLAAAQQHPSAAHNNCSGKHAGMLALAQQLHTDPRGYIDIGHPVQQTIARTMAQMCEYDYAQAAWSPDGCSAPTWAIPLYNLALAFARLAAPEGLPRARQLACQRLFKACVEHPFMVAGTGRYCTEMMSALAPDVFLKTGAEGVYVAAIPQLKQAIALKCEDGATRAAEAAMTWLLDYTGITRQVDPNLLARYRSVAVHNWNGLHTGAIECHSD